MFDEILIFAALGVIAGLLAGLFGIGGGLVIVPVLIGTFINLGFSLDIVVHMAIGSAIACIIFTGLSSAKAHNDKNSINFIHFKPVAFGITFGALAGALFAVQIKGTVLKFAIALFILLMVIKILFNINFSQYICKFKSIVVCMFPPGLGLVSVSSEAEPTSLPEASTS